MATAAPMPRLAPVTIMTFLSVDIADLLFDGAAVSGPGPAPACGPLQRIFQTIVAPEHLAAHHQGRSAENAQFASPVDAAAQGLFGGFMASLLHQSGAVHIQGFQQTTNDGLVL